MQGQRQKVGPKPNKANKVNRTTFMEQKRFHLKVQMKAWRLQEANSKKLNKGDKVNDKK